MDPATLAHLVMNVWNQFGPFVGAAAATAANAVVTDASTDVYNKSKEQVKRLLDAIRHRFSQEKDGGNATMALQAYTAGDALFAPVVEGKITRILQEDPQFSAELQRIMRDGPLQTLIIGEEAKARNVEITNSAGTGTGTQYMDTGKKSDVEGIKLRITGPDET